MTADSGASTWRVYLREWLVVYTSDQLEVLGQQECKAVYARKYGGRVRPEDVRVTSAGALRPGRQVLQLRLPNLKGEFKDPSDAMSLAGDLMDGYTDGACDVVSRGSAEERELLDYGKKMLPEGSVAGE